MHHLIPFTGGFGLSQRRDVSVAVPSAAFTRRDEIALDPFAAELGCADDLIRDAPPGLVAVGPAVSITAKKPINMAVSQRRELDFTIPINPAAFPTAALN